jgi:hypothetical protein
LKKTIAILVITVLLGMALGVNVNRYMTHQHERTTAVMVLLQTHLDEWERAIQGRQCSQASADLTALQFLSKEIAVVLPLADNQDKVFHQYVVKLDQTLASVANQQCVISMADIKSVREACDECHREYR